jgi:hypothetical protein
VCSARTTVEVQFGGVSEGLMTEASRAGPVAEIEITAKRPLWALSFRRNLPTFIVDDTEYTGQPWRTPVRLVVTPGRHTVRILIPYDAYAAALGRRIIIEECGPATVDVDVPVGSVVPITYKPPFWLNRPGRVSAGLPQGP